MLKVATFQYTDRFGTLQNAYLTWSGADINYGSDGSVRFACFENEAEAGRNNRKELFVMPITAENVVAMFTRQGVVAIEVSEASWELAQEVKFIPSRILDEDDQPQMVNQSLTDLNAVITVFKGD